jgi:hypothetical protein
MRRKPPTLPMQRMLPALPILRIDPTLPRLSIEARLPTLKSEPALAALAALAALSTPNALKADHWLRKLRTLRMGTPFYHTPAPPEACKSRCEWTTSNAPSPARLEAKRAVIAQALRGSRTAGDRQRAAATVGTRRAAVEESPRAKRVPS